MYVTLQHFSITMHDYNSTWLIAIVIIIMPPNAVLDYVIIPKYIINSVAQTQALYAIWLRIFKDNSI